MLSNISTSLVKASSAARALSQILIASWFLWICPEPVLERGSKQLTTKGPFFLALAGATTDRRGKKNALLRQFLMKSDH
eukprot:COSAG06_NODE_43847_length_368_cov_0.985130_1_plen_78_part_10